MKKIQAIALIVTMSVGLLVGCGKSQTSDSGNQAGSAETGSAETSSDQKSSTGNDTNTIGSDLLFVEGDLGDAVDVAWDYFDDDEIVSSIMMQTDAITCVPLEINLIDKSGEYVQPNGNVAINFALDDGFDGYYTVYRQESDATFTALDTSIVDGNLVFTTSHFSVYIIVMTRDPIDTNGNLAKLEIVSPEDYWAQKNAEMAAEADRQYQESLTRWPDSSEYNIVELLNGTKLYMSIIDVTEIETLVAESNSLNKWCNYMENLNASSYNIEGFWCSFGKGGSFICGTTSANDIVKTQQLLDEVVSANGFTVVARYGE